MAPLQDPVPKILYFFWKVLRTRLFKNKICKIAQEDLFLQRQKTMFKRAYGVRGMGLPQGPAFVRTAPTINKTKKQKLKKTQVLLRSAITMKHFAFSQRAPKCFIAITVLNKTCVFLVFDFLFCLLS